MWLNKGCNMMDLELVIKQLKNYIDKNKMTINATSVECKMLLSKLQQLRDRNIITNEEINRRLME